MELYDPRSGEPEVWTVYLQKLLQLRNETGKNMNIIRFHFPTTMSNYNVNLSHTALRASVDVEHNGAQSVT